VIKCNMRAKKSLGQNFLKSEPALRKIIEAGEIKPDDVILEIGPGKGKLTEKLLGKTGSLIAVEKDRELFEFLKIKFAKEINAGPLVLVRADILDFDASAQGLKPRAFKVIANIPYNITGAILKKFLTAKNQPERMVLMVQHEVAQRILGGKESLLSISVKAYGEPKILMKVPARYFAPQPAVDSAVIVIKNISRKFFTENKLDEEKFWQIVKAGFAHKRKKLSSNLKNIISIENQTGRELGNKRAEDLSLAEWAEIAKNND